MKTFARCTNNEGYEISLTVGDLYEIADPEPNDPDDMIRIIDDTGEDYLFERDRFEYEGLE